MTTRYEGAGAKDTRITIHMPETPLGDDVLPEGQIALAFNYDEVFYIQGTPGEVAELIGKAERLLESVIQRQRVGVTGNERTQRLDMIAELLWNSDGAPAMNDEDYAAKYKKDAAEQYAEYEAGTLEPWWWQ